MKQTGIAKRVRAAIERLGKGGSQVFSISEICLELDLISDAEKRPVYNCMNDLRASGAVERVRPGVYRTVKQESGPQRQEVMWRLLRARRRVSVADLVELAGVSEAYAAEWLQAMARQGVAVKAGDVYRLVADAVAQPEIVGKKEKYRRIREAKKKALTALDEAFAAIVAARMAVGDIQEGDPNA
jgi:hypothetical protein